MSASERSSSSTFIKLNMVSQLNVGALNGDWGRIQFVFFCFCCFFFELVFLNFSKILANTKAQVSTSSDNLLLFLFEICSKPSEHVHIVYLDFLTCS